MIKYRLRICPANGKVVLKILRLRRRAAMTIFYEREASSPMMDWDSMLSEMLSRCTVKAVVSYGRFPRHESRVDSQKTATTCLSTEYREICHAVTVDPALVSSVSMASSLSSGRAISNIEGA
jgi:hypothetical protein